MNDRFGDVARPNPEEATFLLRDLAMSQDQLSGPARREAQGLLARPTDGASDPTGFGYRTLEAPPACTDDVCIHYVRSTSDAPNLTDASGNGLPDNVDAAKSVFQNDVWATEVDAYGFRPPKSDVSSPTTGGTARSTST